MDQQIVTVLVLAGTYALFSLGLTLAWGVLDVLNIAHGAMMMFGGFSAYWVSERVDLPWPALIALAILVSGTFTALMDATVFATIRRAASDARQIEVLTLIAGVGVAGIPLTLAEASTHDTPFGIPSIHPAVYHVGGVSFSAAQIAVAVLGIGLTIALAIALVRTKQGRALRALAYDRETSQLMGLNPWLLGTATMFAAGALGGLAGVLLMLRLGGIAPNSGEILLLKGFAIVILGGVGSVWGTLLASVFLAVAETLVVQYTSGTWTDGVSFAVIIIVLIVRPQGFLGRNLTERV